MNEENFPENFLQKVIFKRSLPAVIFVVCHSLLAGYLAFWHDNELKSYNIFVTFLDVYYWLVMLPGIIVICFNQFRWYLLGLAVMLYIAAVWIGFGTLTF